MWSPRSAAAWVGSGGTDTAGVGVGARGHGSQMERRAVAVTEGI